MKFEICRLHIMYSGGQCKGVVGYLFSLLRFLAKGCSTNFLLEFSDDFYIFGILIYDKILFLNIFISFSTLYQCYKNFGEHFICKAK